MFTHVGKDLVQHERAHVELIRELELVIQLHVAHRVEVEDDSIQVHDQRVGQVLDAALFLDGHFLETSTAIIVFDFLARDHALERCLQIFLVLDSDLQSVEVFICAHNVATVLAHGK